MDIEKIEKLLTGLVTALEEAGDVSAAAVLPVMQLSLTLHLYKKLESIEQKLDAAKPLLVHRSSRVY
jgi:hypothetical protein